MKELECTLKRYRGLCDELTRLHVTVLGLLARDEPDKQKVCYKAKNVECG